MHSRKIEMVQLFNFRDLGGIINKDFRRIKEGVLYRCPAFYRGCDEDIDIIANQLKVTRVFDFRGKNETDETPDPADQGYEVILNPIMRPWSSTLEYDKEAIEKKRKEMWENRKNNPMNARIGMTQMYRSLALDEYSVSQYRNFLQTLLEENEGATAWHCSMGKDRAGIATVLVLAALDVDLSTIVEDYLYTNECVVQRYKNLSANADVQELKDAFMYDSVDGVQFEYLAAYLEEVNKNYGSLDLFIENQLGIDAEKKKKLKDYYLE